MGIFKSPLSQIQLTPQVLEGKLKPNLKGNLQTIEFMREQAKVYSKAPFVRQYAVSILNEYGVNDHDGVEEALAIGNFVKANVRYVRDPAGVEQLQSPVLMLKQISQGRAHGDCDDMSLLIATLLLSIGHFPSYRAVRYYEKRGPYNHIYVVDYDRRPGGKTERIVLDAILKDRSIGSEIDHVNGKEYAI